MFVIKIKGWDNKTEKNSDVASSFFNSYVPRIRFQPWHVIEVFSTASMCSLSLVV